MLRIGIILAVINIFFLFKAWQASGLIIIPVFSAIVFSFICLFFRVPERKCIKNENLIYAPADGTVVAVEEVFEEEYLKNRCMKISIFMSIFNIHQNIIPVSGKVIYYKYHPGKYLVAYHTKASSKNEHASIVTETNDGLKLMVRQIAGFVARRIICNVKENDIVEQGDELGFIMFGSRVDIYLPANSALKVKTGDKVKANINPIAEIAHTDAYKECKWYPICPLRIFYELACKVPMKSAVAIASTMVAVSTLSVFIGHAVAGHFDYRIAIPLAIGGAIGGLIGGSIAIKTKPKLLKILFALTTLTAAVIMAYKVFN